jgi:hypothetical protein
MMDIGSLTCILRDESLRYGSAVPESTVGGKSECVIKREDMIRL